MAQKFFDLLDHVFKLMSENKLRKDIDDTLLEKLLTFLQKCTVQPSLINGFIIEVPKSNQTTQYDFIEELVKKTSVLQLIHKVNESVAKRDENYFTRIKTFLLRLLGLILESPKELFPLENLFCFPIFIDNENGTITDHIPSIQDALLACLSCITKQLRGTLWFIDNHLQDFVYSSFYSSSYYVRKSAANFFVNFITQWAPLSAPELEGKKSEVERLELFIKRIVSHIIKLLYSYQNPKEMPFSECCIFVTKQLLELENFETIIGRKSESLAKDIAGCFTDLPEENEFNNKIIDLFLAVHYKSNLPDEVITNVIKSLIIREDINISFKLASSFTNIGWPKSYSESEITFFILPIYVLTNTPIHGYNSFFQADFDLIYGKILKKMENKSDCKVLFSSSLSALRKLVPMLHSNQCRDLGLEILKVVKTSDLPQHKWHCSVLEDRSVHHSFLDLLSSFLPVHSSFIDQECDLVFHIIIEFLKKPSSDINFLSQLLLLMKNVLISHEKLEFNLNDADKDSLVHILCRMLLDNRETIVDSSIQLAGQILSGQAWPSWKEKVSKQSVHSIIWDIAIHGCHDGSVRSTALKVIMAGCLQECCLSEMKSLKGITEVDIVKILFDLTYDPDFFLQREALLCLFHWMESKWTDVPASSQDYLFSALVSAIKSLDLELKLVSLDAWLWLIEHKFMYSNAKTSEIKEYIQHLADSGFGLSLLLAIEDYDEAVKHKAAAILFNLKTKLINFGVSQDSITVALCEETSKCHLTVELDEPFTEEKRDEGIDNVMDISTAEQISNICRPPSLSDMYDFKQEYFSTDIKDRKCSVSLLWTHLWSENLVSIVHPEKTDIKSEIESLLNDIIAAKVSDFSPMEETPDCY